MNEAEYLMKNYGDRGGCYRITRSEISIILDMVRKPREVIQNKKKDQKMPLNKLKLNLQRPPIKWLPPIQRPVIKDPK